MKRYKNAKVTLYAWLSATFLGKSAIMENAGPRAFEIQTFPALCSFKIVTSAIHFPVWQQNVARDIVVQDQSITRLISSGIQWPYCMFSKICFSHDVVKITLEHRCLPISLYWWRSHFNCFIFFVDEVDFGAIWWLWNLLVVFNHTTVQRTKKTLYW